MSSWRNEKCFIGDPGKPADSHFAYVQLGPILTELDGESASTSSSIIVIAEPARALSCPQSLSRLPPSSSPPPSS